MMMTRMTRTRRNTQFPVSDGDPEVDPEGLVQWWHPLVRCLATAKSFRGALQDSGVRSCTPAALSDLYHS